MLQGCLPDSPPEDSLRERYDYGQCMYLAVALHEMSGLPIEVTITHDSDGDAYIGHAYVVDGECAIDAIGRNDVLEARFFGADGKDVRRVSVEQLAALCCPPGLDADRLEEARAVARTYFSIAPVPAAT